MHHLLPFMEEEPLYKQIKPQMDALLPNSFGMQRVEGRNTVVGELVCPSNPGGVRTSTPAGDGAGTQGFSAITCSVRARGPTAQRPTVSR